MKGPRRSFGRIGLAVTILAGGLTAASCDDAQPQFGITLSSDGSLEIIHNPCRDSTRAYGVYLERKGDTLPLWQIASDEGSNQRRFTAGETPAGFREVVRLDAPLPEEIVIAISTEPNGRFEGSVDAESVKIADAQTGSVLVPRRGQITSEEFEASSTCD